MPYAMNPDRTTRREPLVIGRFAPRLALSFTLPFALLFALPLALSFVSPFSLTGTLLAQDVTTDAERTAAAEVPAPAGEAGAAEQAEEETAIDPTEAFLSSFDPSKSFSKLLLPSVAERVGLTKDQTAEVNRLMAERAAKLGQASRDQWPDIVRENESALKAVLTPAQLSLFDVTRTEQKIVLRFSKERWADVLKWIAGELGLQLVMDAPPPGTFTYVDKTEYSPKEALDILCGVLQLKGYTLVRQNENLFLHNLKKGPIPLQMLPKITASTLPEQSPNDIVQLSLPLGKRLSSSALRTAKQFLGPYGSAEISPSTGYLVVTDTVHALREILPAVLALPQSSKPSSTPQWEDYPLTNVDPGVVKEQIARFLPTAKPLVNPASRMISFLALPSEQTVIAGIIRRLEAGGDPTREMTFAMYDLSDITASSQQELAAYSNRLGQSVSSSFFQTRQLELSETIVEGFQKIAPSATITINPISRQLIVFALPEDQEKIKAAVDRLKKPLTEEEKPQFALYRLKEKGKELSAAELKALKTLAPQGDMTFDAEKGTLLVVATKEEQEKISQAVEGLNTDYLSQDSQKSFAFYMMTGRQLAQFDSLFRAIANTPEMKGVIPVRDNATRRLSIWATKEQHDRIQQIVDQIKPNTGDGETDEAAAETEEQNPLSGPVPAGRSGLFLETVRVEKGNLASYAQVLTSLFSGLEVTLDPVSRSVIVCGAREDVIAARQTIEKLTQGEDLATKVIPFAGTVSPEALSAFQRSQPLVTVITDNKAKQLILIGPLQGVEQVSKGLEVVLNQEENGTVAQTAKTYMPKYVEGSTLTKIVSELFPTLEVSNGENNRIIIRGAVEKVDEAIKTLEGVDIKEDDATKRSFVAYDVRSMSSVDAAGNAYTPQNLVSDLQKLVPAAKVTYETYGQQIIVWGTEEEHNIIREAIGNLNEKVSVLDRFLRYEIKRAEPSLLTTTITQVYPQLKVSHDTATNSLLIQGNTNSLEGVKPLLELLDPDEPSPFDPTVAVYPFEQEPSAAAVATLRLLAPKATIEINSVSRSLVVIARPAEHKIIEDAIKKIEGVMTTPEPVLAFYPYETPPAESTLSTLQYLAPTARISDLRGDKKLMVVAPPRVQKTVADTLGLFAENTKPNDPILKIYKFREQLDSTFTSTLQTFAPNAQLTLDTDNRQLTVIARTEDIEKIEAQLPTLVDSYADHDRKMIAYAVKGIELETMQSMISSVHPTVTTRLDMAKKRLLIWGTAAEHASIAEEIDKINAEHNIGAYEGLKIVVYKMDGYRKSLQLTRIAKMMFPDIEIIPELSYYSTEQTAAIFATQEEHQRIAELLEQLNNPSNEERMTLDTFSFGQLEPSAVESTARLLLPAATSGSPSFLRQSAPAESTYRGPDDRQPFFRVDPDSRTISVYAEPKDLQRVREGIESTAQAVGERPRVSSKVFSLSSPIATQVASPLSRLLPNATVTISSYSELIIFGTADDLAKAEEFLEGVENAEGAAETRHFSPITVPADSLYPRESLIAQINSSFAASDGHAYPGASADQIVLYGTNRMIERMTEYLKASFTVTEKEVYKTYPVKNLPVTTVTDLLNRLCPNATITPNAQNRTVTVFGSVFVQKQVEEALSQVDVQRADGNEFEIGYYEIGSLPTSAYGHIYHIVYTFIRSQTPEATLIPDISNRVIVAVATRQEQEKIGQFFNSTIASYEANAPLLDVYRLQSINLSAIIKVVQSVTPTVAIFPGKRPNEFFAWAIPSDHERLRQTLAKLESIDENSPTGMVPKIYSLDKRALETVLPRLRESIPSAMIYPLTDNRVIVWGSDAEHRLAAELLETVAEAFPEQTIAKYTPVHVTIGDLNYNLQAKYYPDAIMYPTSMGDLVVRAPRELQEKIAEEIKLFDVPASEEARPVAKAYDVSSIPVSSLSSVVPNILRVIPEAIFLPTQTPGYFVIYARPEAQKKVAELVAEIVKVQPWLKTRTECYTLENLTQSGAIALLSPLATTAVMVPGTERNQLIVTAREDEHERIAEALLKAAGQTEGDLVNHIYHLERANLTRAQTVLLTLYPTEVRCLIDPMARTLTVNASPRYQKKVEELIAELDRVDEQTQPQVETFSLAGINPTAVTTPLTSFYAADPAFHLSYDTAYRTLVVRGSKEQINFTGALIDRLRDGGLSDPALVFKTYTMRNPWSFYTIRNIFTNQGRDLYMFQDYSTGKLLVMARPEEHQVIDDILTAMAPEKTQLEIFELAYVDPQTAYNIISTMLENDGSFVDVQYDASSNRLYVRANSRKLEEIRRFLIEAGEKDLEKSSPIDAPIDTPIGTVPAPKAGTSPAGDTAGNTTGDTAADIAGDIAAGTEANAGTDADGMVTTSVMGSGTMRTIRADSANLRQAVEAVQKEWSLKNPISVLEQGGTIVQRRSDEPGITEPSVPPAEEPPVPAESSAPAVETPPVPDEPSAPAAESPAAPEEKPADGSAGAMRTIKNVLVSLAIAQPMNAAAAVLEGEPVSEQPITEQAATERSTADAREIAPGIYAVMGEDGSLMITSSDTEALEKFQAAILAKVADQKRTADQTARSQTAPSQVAPSQTVPSQTAQLQTAPSQTVPSQGEVTPESDGDKTTAGSVNSGASFNEEKNVRTLARQNAEAARAKLVMEDRNFSVYKVEEVSVDLLLSRLTYYMADRINPPRMTLTPSPTMSARGISMKTISSGPRLTFTPDRVLNTIMVKGNKVDRDEAGAMITLLDRPELFPQPVTKPFKVPVKNTTVQKMATHVLNAFQQKFMTMKLPGNQVPRVSPNTETNTLEIYAPESLALEIAEYVKQTDEEILHDPNRKHVQVVKLQHINSSVLQKYISNFRASQAQFNYMTPYMFNPNSYYRRAGQ